MSQPSAECSNVLLSWQTARSCVGHMNDQVQKLLAGVSSDTFTSVARGVLGDTSAELTGKPEWQPVGGRHGDLQTVAVMKCSGRAYSGGIEKPWSAVFKHIDLSVETNFHSGWTDPLNEIALYRDGEFVSSEVPFRAAKCYLIDEHDPQRFSVWLEDLSTAVGPPWSADQYEQASGYLGQLQGQLLAERTRLPYVDESNRFENRWEGWNFDHTRNVLQEHRSHPDIERAFSGNRLDLMIELIQSFPMLLKKVGQVERVLSHGDCHARNLFLTDEALVAIDWSGISYEPLGSDFGQLVGAGLSWGFEEMIVVAEAAPRLFDAYVQGLSAMGWDGDESTLRLGMAGQFIGYVIVCSSYPARVIDDPSFAAGIEGRSGIPRDEISAATARFLDFAEPFIHEAIELSDG